MAFLASGSISNAGSVTVLGKRFRGGARENTASPTGCTALDGIPTANGGAHKGEGAVLGVYSTATGATLTNGYGNRGTGGGGGNLGPGGKGGNTFGTNQPYGGNGGAAQLFSLSDHLSFGEGGGAGDENNNVGTAGGAGGGVIFVGAASASGGSYNADGVGQPGSGQNDGQGGGGAGGSVLLALTGALNCSGVSAAGGVGGNVAASHGAGGGGYTHQLILRHVRGEFGQWCGRHRRQRRHWRHHRDHGTGATDCRRALRFCNRNMRRLHGSRRLCNAHGRSLLPSCRRQMRQLHR